jgi:hypothetical protein
MFYWFMTRFSGQIYEFFVAEPVGESVVIVNTQHHERDQGWRVSRKDEFRFFKSVKDAQVVQDKERAENAFNHEEYLKEFPGVHGFHSQSASS